jgi:AraC-like DNA-binding protein
MFTEILLLNPIYVTLFWAITLSIHKTQGHKPKVFLGWFMGMASIIYISHFFYFTKNIDVYLYFDGYYTLAYLLVYPMYHIYARLLTVDNRFSLKVHGKFIVLPIAISLLTFIGYVILGAEGGRIYISQVLIEGIAPVGTQTYMYYLYIIGRIVFLLQTIVYLILSFKLIKANNLRLQDYYSNMEERKLNWVHYFNVCFAFTSFSSAVLVSLGRNFFLQNEWLLLFPSIIFTGMLFFIGLLGNSQKAIFTEIDNSTETLDEGKPPYKLKAKLDELFIKNKIHKDTDLKIWDVTSMLGTNRTYVSKIINQEYGRNFCAHVNYYRVANAKELIANNPNLTNEQIAELSGFGSVNSLYRAFLSSENISLGSFRKKD